MRTARLFAFLFLFVAHLTFADTCRENGGNQTCTGDKPSPGPWSYYVYSCIRAFSCNTSFDNAACTAFGGTPQCDSFGCCTSCAGAHPQESLIGAAVANGWTAYDNACTMSASPSAWGVTLSKAVCGQFDADESYPTTYSQGVETGSHKAVPASGTMTKTNGCTQADSHLEPSAAYAARTRSITWQCPYTNGSCAAYQDNTCGVGHPCKTATGAKVFKETDYTSSGSPLALMRYYNSEGFWRPPSSTVLSPGTLGDYWQTNYDRRLFPISGSSSVAVAARRPDGLVKYFNASGAEVQHFSGAAADTLTPVSGGGWTLTRGDDEVETYSATGYLTGLWDNSNLSQTITYDTSNRIQTVTDARGRQLTFSYSGDSQQGDIKTYSAGTATVTFPDGNSVQYSIDTSGNLLTVTFPGSVTRQFAYSNTSYPNLVTDITDENGQANEHIDYDSLGRVQDSYLAPGLSGNTIGKFSYVYNTNGSTTLTDPLGWTANLTYSNVAGVLNVAGSSQPCVSCGASGKLKSLYYDTAGFLQTTTDFNNYQTGFTFDDVRGLETQRIEAVGQISQRTTNTLWDAGFHVPDQRTLINSNNVMESLSKWTYNTRGQVSARCEIDPTISLALKVQCSPYTTAPTGVRKWVYTYCESIGTGCPIVGLLLSVDGPRIDVSDVTTYAYFQSADLSGCAVPGNTCHYVGDVETVTNAMGQVTTYLSYDKNGRVTRLQDANGTYTDMTYTPRGWLWTRTVRANADGTPNSVLDATTTFAYDNVGNVLQVTQPAGDFLHFTYDAAHRLTDIQDNLTDHIHYTLDAAGNRTLEQTYDASSALKRALTRQYDQLNHLQVLKNNALQPVQTFTNPSELPPTGITYTDGYDSNGNAVYSTDGRSTPVGTEQQYDPLNRLAKSLQDHAGPGPTANTTTQYAYDTRDNLRSVIDPDNLTTNYTYDGLNNLTSLSSPDTGTTSYTYDAAGNRLTQLDMKGVTATYAYDALNRLRSITYPSVSPVAYTFDEVVSGCYNIGRLTTMTDASGSTTYCYDRRGNVVTKTQSTSVVFACPGGTCGSQTQGVSSRVTETSMPTVSQGSQNVVTSLVTSTAYDRSDRIIAITYPSGTMVKYLRNVLGQVYQVTLTQAGTTTTLISNATYYPFGPLSALSFANGRVLTKTYDQDYHIASVVDSGGTPLALSEGFGVDPMGNVQSMKEPASVASATRTYDYDPLYRLLDAKDTGSNVLEAYTYDHTGDRLSKQLSGSASQSYVYNLASSHRVQSIAGVARSYDGNGNTVSGTAYAAPQYDERNRLTSLTATSASVPSGYTSAAYTYNYNGRGERVVKQVALTQPACGPPTCNPVSSSVSSKGVGVASVGVPAKTQSSNGAQTYTYDENGALLGEYPVAGGTGNSFAIQSQTDYLYLDGQPIAFLSGGRTYYIETDHLGSPRVVIDAVRNVPVWSWDAAASTFGENAPNQDPDADGTALVLNVRLPGQYFDQESGLSYNYFRDYEPGTGRYVESDPIGLRGGLNTYAYVSDHPLTSFDPKGLDATPWPPPVAPPPTGIWPRIWKVCRVANPIVTAILIGITPTPTSGCDQPNPPPQNHCDKGDSHCEEEISDCRRLCRKASNDPDMKNIWGGSWARCMAGCVSFACQDHLDPNEYQDPGK